MNDIEQKDFGKYRARMSKQMGELLEEVIELRAELKQIKSSIDNVTKLEVKEVSPYNE